MQERQVLLVRHGEADYEATARRSPVYDGGRYDFAPLSKTGIRQVEQLIPALRLKDPSLIVSSPYTRALQTAGALAVSLGCQLTVDLDLHDWLPDRDGGQTLSSEVVVAKIAEYYERRSTGKLRAALDRQATSRSDMGN